MHAAKDIMTKNLLTVKKSVSIYKAAELIIENNISEISVVEDDMTLAGVLSEKDVIALFYAEEDSSDKTVADFMASPLIHFNENESLVEVCDFMAKNSFRTVPVTSDGKVVGVISIRDILKYTLQSKINNCFSNRLANLESPRRDSDPQPSETI